LKEGEIVGQKFVKMFAFLLALLILMLIVLAGPAQSLITGFTISNSVVKIGESTIFTVSAEIESQEILDIKNLTLMLTGPTSLSCIFDTDGNPLSSCPGISIQKLQSPPFQFGYGFLPGILEYKVVMNSSVLDKGTYDVKFLLNLPNQQIQTEQKELTVIIQGEEITQCSLRAKSGTVNIGETLFNSKNDLSLYVGGTASSNGKGTLTVQKGKSRATYNFNINNAFLLDANTIIFETSGELQIDRNAKNLETATIIFKTDSTEIDINGLSINAENLDVSFAKC